jgi:hypothetical protein
MTGTGFLPQTAITPQDERLEMRGEDEAEVMLFDLA